MSDQQYESGEETIDDSGRNLTQQSIDDDGASDAPLDVEQDDGGEGGGEEL